MTDCVSLSPKVYSYNYQSANGEIINSKKLKGLSTPVVSNEISHNDQITTLDTNKPIKRKTTSFRRRNHQVYALTQEQIALTSWYDKAVLLDSVYTVPYGYMLEV